MVSSNSAGSRRSLWRATTGDWRRLATTGGFELQPSASANENGSSVELRLNLKTSSIGVLVDEALPQGHRQNLQIEHVGPVSNVEEIAFDSAIERGIATPAVHLRPAGDASPHLVAKHVVRDLAAELMHEDGPLWPRADQ